MADPTLVSETQWAKTLGGLANERAVAVEKTPGGGYMVVGDNTIDGADLQAFIPHLGRVDCPCQFRQ